VKPGKNYVHITDDGKCQMIYNDDIKCHKPISYILNSAALSGLNNRLCRLLKFPNKNIGVNTFRSSFVL